MLQVASGKLFTYPARSNLLRGVLYTNVHLPHDTSVETAIGTFTPLAHSRHGNAISWNFIEQVEGTENGPGILISNGIDTYIDDCADIISFALDCICTPSSTIAERLLNKGGRRSRDSAKKLLPKFFEEDIYVRQELIPQFQELTKDLIGLPRAKFTGVMKSIRTYVAALHRLEEDVNLAYTLLVMSLETLVQDFDGYESNWSDIEERKRRPLEKALEGVDTAQADIIKNTLVKVEHVAASKRFKAFIKKHITDDHFSPQASGESAPVGKRDFEAALSNVYDIRSKYVHTLRPLPNEFLAFSDSREAVHIGDDLIFTIRGLQRIAKTVITSFILNQEKIIKEPYNYSLESPNIIRARMCPSTWISRTDGLLPTSYRLYFDGYISLLDQFFENFPNKKPYDVRDVLDTGLKQRAQLKQEQHRSLVGLYLIFTSITHTHNHPKAKLKKTDFDKINTPSVESLITHIATGEPIDWPITEQIKHHENYFKKRYKASEIKIPRRLEACLELALAERYRESGEHPRAVEKLKSATLDYPEISEIKEFAKSFPPDKPIDWLLIVYPALAEERPKSTLDLSGL